MPTLSIIIVNFNTKKLLIDCLNSIENEKSVDCEIIVVDNGSTDGSKELLNNLKFKIKNLKFIENEKNLGFARANNQGIKIAKGKYILLLNSDTKVKKGALAKMVDFAEKTPDAGVVGARLLNPDGSLQDSCLHFPTISRAIREYWLGEKGMYGKFAPKGEKPLAVDAVVGAAFLITPKALKKVGMLDEKYFMYFEDLDYCRRTVKAGLTVYCLPSAEIYHHHGASGGKTISDKKQWYRLIPGSKIYHGRLKYYLISLILWTGQKLRKN